MIMNHELVHVVTMDQAAGRDPFFRRLFGGKVMPVAEQPESILYFYLTRRASPRRAGIRRACAVFIDTWMDGGIGRAQGGYDEMVFRAMVSDNARFYDPLGLVSEGTKIDFQVEVNSYLYGTRFMTWLARPVFAREADRVGLAPARQPRVLRDAVPASVRQLARSRPGRTGSRTRRRSSRRTSRRSASTRSRRTRTCRRARSDRCRARSTTRRTGTIYAGVQLPGRGRAHRRRSRSTTGAVRAPDGHQGPAHVPGDVARLGSGRTHALLHDRQRRASRPREARSGDRAHARCCRRTRASATWRSTAPTSRSGASAT